MVKKEETRTLTETAFWAILNTGAAPTVDSVNAWLREHGHGGRNRTVISTELKACWAKLGARVKEVNTLPGIPDEIVMLVLKLRDDMAALASQQFDQERTELQQEADARVAAAQAEVAAAQATADAAKLAKREADAAFVTLQDEHRRVLGEVTTLRAQLDESLRQITALNLQLGQAQEALEREQRDRKTEQDAAHESRKRFNLELDRLRTDLKNQADRFERQQEKLQGQIDAAAARERQLHTDNARLQAEIGALHGAQAVLKTHNAELSKERDHVRTEASTHAVHAAAAEEKNRTLSARVDELAAELATRVPLSVDELHRLVAEAYLDGAKGASRPTKGKEQSEEIAARAEQYATRHCHTPRTRGQ